MIAHLTGNTLSVGATHIIVEAAGVGYKVHAPVSVLASAQEGEQLSLFIHTAFREGAIELFGFSSELEQEVFELLISVSGVGPRTALGALSAMSVRDIAAAAQDQGARLQTIPGIGKKTAQRIALEVGEKLQELAIVAAATEGETYQPDALSDVIEGLVALGYNRNDARRAAQTAQKNLPGEKNAGSLLKEALAILTG